MELENFGAALRAVERPERPGTGQVRIRVRAATVNPADWLVAGGVLARLTAHLPFPLVLGWDAVGEVDAVGPDAGLRVGEQVAALSPWLDRGAGTFAEAVVLDTASVAPLPAGVDPVEAATVPLNGLTARQALDLAAPEPGSGSSSPGRAAPSAGSPCSWPRRGGSRWWRWPRTATRSGCAGWARPRCWRAATTWWPPCGPWRPTAWTRCSTPSRSGRS